MVVSPGWQRAAQWSQKDRAADAECYGAREKREAERGRAGCKDTGQKKEEGRTYSATSCLERSLSLELILDLKDGNSTDATEANTWTESHTDVSLLSIKEKPFITKEHSLKT